MALPTATCVSAEDCDAMTSAIVFRGILRILFGQLSAVTPLP